jgi:hypothetical protein
MTMSLVSSNVKEKSLPIYKVSLMTVICFCGVKGRSDNVISEFSVRENGWSLQQCQPSHVNIPFTMSCRAGDCPKLPGFPQKNLRKGDSLGDVPKN